MAQAHTRRQENMILEDEDLEWEEKFAEIEELQPLFTKKLPTTHKEARVVFEKYYDPSHVGPIALMRNVTADAFGRWLAFNTLGLYKSSILPSGTVYCAQVPTEDHGRIRSLFMSDNDGLYPSITQTREIKGILRCGSGARDGMKPDVFWEKRFEPNAGTRSVVFEVGTTQSLPNLRQRAYQFFATNEFYISRDVRYCVLIRRYRRHVYVEVWRRRVNQSVLPVPGFWGGAPEDLQQVPPCMMFVGNAHAQIDAGDLLPVSLQWMSELGTYVSLTEADIVDEGSEHVQVIFDAQFMLEESELDGGDFLPARLQWMMTELGTYLEHTEAEVVDGGT